MYVIWLMVENINRLPRKHYHKSTDLPTIDTEELMMNAEKINQQHKNVVIPRILDTTTTKHKNKCDVFNEKDLINEYERLLVAA